MKKILTLFLFASLFALTGCYETHYAKLLDIKLFSASYTEMEGEFEEVDYNEISAKLNSPAPSIFYYTAYSSLELKYIRLIIELGENCDFDRISFNSISFNKNKFSRIVYDDNLVYLDFDIEELRKAEKEQNLASSTEDTIIELSSLYYVVQRTPMSVNYGSLRYSDHGYIRGIRIKGEKPSTESTI